MTISAPINNSIDVRLPNTPELVDDPKVFNELLMVYQAIKNLQAAAGVMKPSSITATMAAGALTFGATSRYLDFAKATLTDGTNTTLLATPTNLVLPSGGTLGTPTTLTARIVLVEMNIAGVAELAVVNIAGGNDLSETGVISTTAISATSTANNVFYSTTARTGVAYRIVGIVDSVNTAGAWAAPTLVRGAVGNVATAMSSLGYGQTWQDLSASRVSATTYYNITGKPITVIVSVLNDAAGAVSSFILYVNGVAVAYPGLSTDRRAASGALVPPSASYSLSLSGTAAIAIWAELR